MRINQDPQNQVSAIRDMLTELDAWKLRDTWPAVRTSLVRADQLTGSVEAVPRPGPRPSDAQLAAELAAGALEPGDLPELIRPTTTAQDEQLRRVLGTAAAKARTVTIEAARRYSDRLVTEDLRPVVAGAIARGDAETWLRIADLVDVLRAAGVLPTKSGNSVYRAFDPWQFRSAEPELLTVEQRNLPPAELLRSAQAAGCRPGLYSDQEVLLRTWTPREAAAIG